MKKIICGIYLIFNRVNKKKYVGQSKDIEDRWIKHKCALNNNKRENEHLQNAWNKYGESAFKFTKIEECPEEKLNEREQFWMDKLEVCNREKGYNIRPRADHSKHSEETLKKMSSWQIGRKLSDEHRKKISFAQKGRKRSEESLAKRKITKQKMMEEELNLNKEDLERMYVQENKSITEIAKFYQTNNPRINRALRLYGFKIKSLSDSMKGRKLSQEHIQKYRETRKKNGKRMSEEQKLAVSKQHKGKKVSPESTAKRLATIERNRLSKIEKENKNGKT